MSLFILSFISPVPSHEVGKRTEYCFTYRGWIWDSVVVYSYPPFRIFQRMTDLNHEHIRTSGLSVIPDMSMISTRTPFRWGYTSDSKELIVGRFVLLGSRTVTFPDLKILHRIIVSQFLLTTRHRTVYIQGTEFGLEIIWDWKSRYLCYRSYRLQGLTPEVSTPCPSLTRCSVSHSIITILGPVSSVRHVPPFGHCTGGNYKRRP